MRTTRSIALVLLTILLFITCYGQVDTIDIHRDLLLRYLPEGRSLYSVSVAGSNGVMRYVGLWDRSVRFATINGKECLVIEQDWSTSDTAAHRRVYSISLRKDFSPLFHYSKDGKGKVEAYDFSSEQVTGSDTAAGNAKAGFTLPLTAPTLNWELDMEVFQVLPYALNKTFFINFYHPGGPPPNYYKYVVGREEPLPLAGGGTAECWVLSIDYGNNNTADFWISKKTREVLKTRDLFRGGYRFKVKLATETK